MNKSTQRLYIPDEDEYNHEKQIQRERLSRFFKITIGTLLLSAALYFISMYHPDGPQPGMEQGGLQGEPESQLPYSDRFIQFIEKFERDYEGPEETMERFKHYERKMREVAELNKQKKYGAEYGENDMADWTDEEFRDMLLPMNFYKRLREEASFIRNDPPKLERAAPVPDFFDWRAKNGVTPVKAQGKCGSCWAFAATATVESAWMLKTGEARNLSEQTLLDCDMSNDACNGGDEDKAFRFIHRTGLAFAVDLPYVAHRQNKCELAGKDTTKIEIAYFLHQDENAMIDWLVHYGPVNVGMSVTQPMRAYKTGVFTPDADECINKVIGLHALLVVGYGTDEASGEKYWIIKNSWGATWGDHGYIKFRRGINACGIEDEPVGILA